MNNEIAITLLKVDDLPGEEWRPIKDYPRYEVSNMGRVKMIRHEYCSANRTYSVFYPERLLKPLKTKKGYLVVYLYNYRGPKMKRIHRLVAEAFIPNPDNLPCVNHKTEDKTINTPDALEWCDDKYNSNYGTRNERLSKSLKGTVFTEERKRNITKAIRKSCGKPVIADGTEFECMIDAAKYYDVDFRTMSDWLIGKRKMPEKYRALGLRYK